MSRPEISVVVPAYNPGSYLREAVQSALEQTRPALEVIVVDDGSGERIETTLRGLPVRLFRRPHRGDAAARNFGVGQARGAYLALLDSDDRWRSEALETLSDYLEAHPQVLAVSMEVQRMAADGRPLDRFGRKRSPGEFYTTATLLGEDWGHFHAMVRRECFEMTGCFDEGLPHASDIDFWIRASLIGRLACCREVLLLKRQHPGSKASLLERRTKYQARADVLEKLCREHPEAARVHRTLIRKRLSRFYSKLAKAHLTHPESPPGVARRAAARSLALRPLQLGALLYWLRSPRAGSRPEETP